MRVHGNLVRFNSEHDAELLSGIALELKSGVIQGLSTKESRGSSIFLPAFIDLHFHWVQDEISLGKKTSLNGWLKEFAVPTEQKFAQKSHSRSAAQKFSEKLIRSGTTAGLAYAAVWSHSASDFYGEMQAKGFRDFKVGSVSMLELETETESMDKLAGLYKVLGDDLVVSPRFLPSVDPQLLKELSAFARKHDLWMQSHLAETKDPLESDWKLFYEAGCFGPKTVLGHCIHLPQEAFEKMAETKTVVAHCPSSNAPLDEMGLGSGLFDLDMARESSLRWALASDIGAGPYLSMLDVMRSFYQQHKAAGRKVTATQAFYRASIAGAEILGLDLDIKEGAEINFVEIDASGLDLNAGAEALLADLLSLSRAELQQRLKTVYYRGERYCV